MFHSPSVLTSQLFIKFIHILQYKKTTTATATRINRQPTNRPNERKTDRQTRLRTSELTHCNYAMKKSFKIFESLPQKTDMAVPKIAGLRDGEECRGVTQRCDVLMGWGHQVRMAESVDGDKFFFYVKLELDFKRTLYIMGINRS